MEFRILGPLTVVHDGRTIDLGAYKQRAVLALLLINSGRVVSLDRLIDQLWSEQPPPRATASLQSYISRLRRILEPDRNPRDAAAVLVTRPPGYSLSVDDTAVDARRFEALAEEGHSLLEAKTPAAASDVLREALELWRGAALEEFAFEPFAESEIRRLEELRLTVVEDHLTADLALGRHAPAIPRLEALLVEHPFRERLWELLMIALYRAGRQSEALRTYQAARAALAEELGLEPGPRLRRLEAEILSHADSLDWRSDAEELLTIAPVRLPSSPPDSVTGDAPRLIGRDAPKARVIDVLRQAASGSGGVVLIVGDAGIGKTRLLRELVVWAESNGYQVGCGDTHEGAAELPFWPWAQLLSQLLGTVDESVLRDLMGPGASELLHVLPELADAFATTPPRAPDHDAARFRAFEAVARLLVARAEQQPLLAVIEDLHWADEASLQLIAFVASRLRQHPIVLVGTYRATDVPPSHPLSATLAVLAREDVVTRIALAGLNHGEIERLIAETTGQQPVGEVVTVVHERTEGNPFFASELVRLMLSERTLEDDLDRLASAIPVGVTDVVSRRVNRLPENTVALLALAAVLGREFDFAELTAVAGEEMSQVIERLEPALLTGLLVEDREVIGRLRFSHALVQETVYSSLTAVRRAHMHGQVARTLRSIRGSDDEHVPEMSRHFYLAGPTAEHELAFDYAVRAADISRDRFLYDQALLHLDRALAALPRFPDERERDRRELEVVTRRSVVLALTRGYASDEVATASTRAHELSLRVGDTHQLTAALWSVWAMWVVRGDFRAGELFARQLLQLGDDTGDARPSIGGHQASGADAVHLGAPAVGRDRLIEAIRRADELGDPSLAETFLQHPAVFSRGFLALAEWLLGDPDAATGYSSDALELARELGHPFTLSLALFFDAWLEVFQGNPFRVAERAREAVDLSDEHSFALVSEMAAILGGWATAKLGRPDEGCEAAAAGLASMDARQARMLRHFFLGLLADAHLSGGRHVEGLRLVDDAFVVIAAVGERFYEPELHRLRAELLAADGSPPDQVKACLAQALAASQEQGARGFDTRIRESLDTLSSRS